MTDLEISKALALAIGWKESALYVNHYGALQIDISNTTEPNPIWAVFDYRDWNVIGPIAEKYNAFPLGHSHNRGWLSNRAPLGCAHLYYADTPQKAIALAVIGAKK